MAANTFTDGRAMTAQEVSRIAAAPAGQYGALSNVGGAVTVSAGMTLNVAAVAANTVTINGTVAATAYAGSTVTISASDPTNPRRDAITYDSAGAVAVTAGTPAAVTATTGPVLPTITASQYLLAEVYVGAGVTSITSGNIVDRRQVTALFGVSGATLTAAATLPITNQVHHVTGGTTITALPTWPSGAIVSLTFDGATPITHNATSLILIGGVSITTAAADTLVFISEGSGNWRQIVSPSSSWFALAQKFVEDSGDKSFFALGSGNSGVAYANNDKIGLGFAVNKVNSGAVTGSPSGSGGGWLLDTSTTNSSQAGFGGPRFAASDDWTYVARVAPTSAATQSMLFGAETNGSFNDQNNIIAFRITDTGNIIGVCDSGGTETTRDTSFVPDGTEQKLRIEVRSGGTIVRFYRNGTQVGADVTTNIPTGDLIITTGVNNKTAGASRTCKVFDIFGRRDV